MLSSVSRYTVNFPAGSLLEPAASFEEAKGRGTHHFITSAREGEFLAGAAGRIEDPAALSLLPTGESHRTRGEQYKLIEMPFRPYAEVCKTTLIPVVVAHDPVRGKRTYMLLDHKSSVDGKGAGSVKFIQSPSTYFQKADRSIEHQTNSYQALLLLSEKGASLKDVECPADFSKVGEAECPSDFSKVEQDKMKAQVTFQGVKCTALFQRAVDFRVAGDRSCNRNVVYTAIITPEKGSVLSKASLERDYRLLDVTSEVDGSSTAEKAKEVAESCITKFSVNFQRTKDDALILGSALHKIYSVIGRSRFTTPTAYAYYAAIIGVIGWILSARRAV
jgi:hypothetical protein